MNVEIKEAGDARKIVNVSFDKDEMSKMGKEVCKELSKIANIPGFRKGKAPEQVIRKKYASEIIQELKRKVSNAAYDAVLENKEIMSYNDENEAYVYFNFDEETEVGKDWSLDEWQLHYGLISRLVAKEYMTLQSRLGEIDLLSEYKQIYDRLSL